MNTPNNKRRKESKRRIGRAFIQLLQERELSEITVTDICAEAQVNRTTFYANFEDIFALADGIRQELQQEVLGLYQTGETQQYNNLFLSLFCHIRENQLFYKTYFKLERGDTIPFMGDEIEQYTQYYGNALYGAGYMDYHIAFFKSGLNAIIKKWLEGGCRETPEEMASIIVSEYAPKRELQG